MADMKNAYSPRLVPEHRVVNGGEDTVYPDTHLVFYQEVV
jgi:hypothetical protein